MHILQWNKLKRTHSYYMFSLYTMALARSYTGSKLIVGIMLNQMSSNPKSKCVQNSAISTALPWSVYEIKLDQGTPLLHHIDVALSKMPRTYNVPEALCDVISTIHLLPTPLLIFEYSRRAPDRHKQTNIWNILGPSLHSSPVLITIQKCIFWVLSDFSY